MRLQEIAENAKRAVEATGVTTEQVIQYLQEGYLRSLGFLVAQYVWMIDMGETLENAYTKWAEEIGNPPLTDLEKKQAVLNYIITRRER